MDKSDFDALLESVAPDAFAALDNALGRLFPEPKTKAGKAKAARDATRYQPKYMRPKCGAKTRAGGTCQARAVPGMLRCRLHGGLSTGPKTAAGRRAIGEANRRRAG